MTPRDAVTMHEILRRAKRVEELFREYTYDDFKANWRVHDLVMHEFEILGEAARRLTPEVRSAHPEIAWHAIIGFRDRLIHGYDAVDYELVWDTARDDIPQLIAEITPLIPEVPAEE
jgi:uncharacterized protein with HEPN domain